VEPLPIDYSPFTMSNINDTYFDGNYKEIWKTLVPELLTVKEVDFMIPYFGLQPGSRVLDLMCGYGRHAIAFGRKGISVTAIDNLPAYITEIKETVQKENLPVRTLQQSILDLTTDEEYDLAICMGNSLNFFNAADIRAILSNVSSCLKTGGHLLINSWSLAEIIFKSFKEKSSDTIGGMEFNNESKILFQPTRMETASTIISPGGTTELKQAIDYIYSINEMEAMLQQAGLSLQEVYSIPGKKKFLVGEPRAYLVAVKE
jgi:2-polyprenyl-3-methyl-5-hydroxy-6-metoxy-1,4-benzoquinol methylase